MDQSLDNSSANIVKKQTTRRRKQYEFDMAFELESIQIDKQ